MDANNDKRNKSTNKILMAAASEFVKHGYCGTTLTAVAKTAGVTQGLISQRFLNKEDLFTHVISYAFTEISNDVSVDLPFEEVISKTIMRLNNKGDVNYNLYEFLAKLLDSNELPPVIMEQFRKCLNESGMLNAIDNAKQEGYLYCEDSYEWALSTLKTLWGINKVYSDSGMGTPKSGLYFELLRLNSNKFKSIIENCSAYELSEFIPDAIEVLADFVEDYNSVFVVNLRTGKMQLYKAQGDYEAWIKDKFKLDYDEYRKEFVDEFISPEDKDWFLEETAKEKIIEHLEKEDVFLFNHRINKNGQSFFYQTRFVKPPVKYGKDVILLGGHSIDEAVRIEREKEFATEHQTATIAELAGDFECVEYVSLLGKKGEDDTVCYRRSKNFERITAEWSVEKNFHRRIHLLRDNIVLEDEREIFDEKTKYRKILENLEKNSHYFVNFRAKIDGEISYYQAKFSADYFEGKLRGFVLGIRCADEEVKASMDREKELTLTVSNRTAALQEKNRALNRMNAEIVELLGDVVESRDEESGEHIRRVKGFTNILANQVRIDLPEYGLTQQDVNLITSASALHDVGKIMISDTILLKPGKLTKEEFDIMKTHTVKGCEILKKAPRDWSQAYLKTSMDICNYHHEKWDGKGYPLGLRKDEIPISAQIVSIADCYDALTTKRVYKDAFSCEQAYNMIVNGECGAFSDKLLECFSKCKDKFAKHAIESIAEIDSYSSAEINADSLANTKILLVEDNELSMAITSEILTSEGANVVEAENGRIALDIFRNSKEDEFDMIVTDVLMPELDGIEMTAAIRSMATDYALNIPILALTARYSKEQSASCMSAGADLYVCKPLVVTYLTELMDNANAKKKSKISYAKIS